MPERGIAQYAEELQIPEVIPASPEAVSLAKYLNYPMNYSTGLPSIEIPLYVIQTGDLTLPISLSYHASGIKVYDSKSWVGMGWTLNAGPSISRSVKGKPDEDYYLRRDTPLVNNPPKEYKVAMANGQQDEQPDEFYYKLLSKSGGFYLQPRLSTTKYKGVSHPFEPIDIELLNISMNGFRIKDDDGTTYNFGTNNTSQESVINLQSTITAWKVDNIRSNKPNNEISFAYFPYEQEYVYNRTDIITVEDKRNPPSTTPPTSTTCQQYYPVVKDSYIGTRTVDQQGNFNYCNSSTVTLPLRDQIKTIKIKEITFSSGKIIFKKNTDGTLNFIEIYNKDELIKKIKLTISPYPGFTNAVRPKLDKIEIMDKTGEVVEEYSFEYNNNVTLPNPYNSKQVDHWGYYLGSGNASTLVPFITVNATNSYLSSSVYGPAFEVDFPIGNISRNADPTAWNTKAGILTKLTYPTSGYTEFEYEANKYMDLETQTIETAGGLRVSKISSYDPNSQKKLIRRFKYGENENGLGFIKHKIDLDDYMIQNENDYAQYSTLTTRLRTYYGNSLKNLFFNEGAPTVYKEVTEYEEDVSGNTIGKTVYKYNQYNSAFSSNRIGLTSVFIDPNDDWKRGQLLSKTEYKYENNIYLPVRKLTNNYTSNLNAATIPVGEVFRNKNLYWSNYIDYTYEDVSYYRYYINTGAIRLSSDKLITYIYNGGIQNDSIETINNYSYENPLHLYPTKITTITSDPTKSIITNNKYVQDITFSGTAEQARQNLIQNGRIKSLMEQVKTVGSHNEKQIYNYKVFDGSAMLELIQFQKANGTLESRVLYHGYDSYGNPLEVSKADGPHIFYLWGYNGQYPIAKIENTTKTALENVLGELKNVNETDLTAINNLRTNSSFKNVMITTFTYKPLVGMTVMTDPRGRTTTYEYDDFGRLEIVKDHEGKLLEEYEYHYKGE